MRAEIDQIAADLRVTEEARRKWRARGAVPHRWRIPVLAEAGKRGVLLTIADMEWVPDAADPPSRTRTRGRQRAEAA